MTEPYRLELAAGGFIEHELTDDGRIRMTIGTADGRTSTTHLTLDQASELATQALDVQRIGRRMARVRPTDPGDRPDDPPGTRTERRQSAAPYPNASQEVVKTYPDGTTRRWSRPRQDVEWEEDPT